LINTDETEENKLKFTLKTEPEMWTEARYVVIVLIWFPCSVTVVTTQQRVNVLHP